MTEIIDEAAEARIIVRRSNVVIPLTEWLKPDVFAENAEKFRVLSTLKPKGVVMTVETRSTLESDRVES